MLGDGHIGKYQSSITTNSETDREHAEYVSKLVTQSLTKTLYQP